jgi:hypothetical protein
MTNERCNSVHPEVIRNLPASSVRDLKYFPLTFKISTQSTVQEFGGWKRKLGRIGGSIPPEKSEDV